MTARVIIISTRGNTLTKVLAGYEKHTKEREANNMAKEQTIYEKLFFKIYNHVDAMMSCYKNKDLLRNQTNYGAATAYATMMLEIGYDVDLRVYADGDYLITDKITINGKDYDFFH